MTIQQFLLILRARYLVALVVLLLTVTAVLIYSLVMPKQYVAATTVVLDVKSADLLTGMSMSGTASPGYMATQVDIIRSNRVARAAVKQLRLDQNPSVLQMWREATGGKGDVSDWMAGTLQRNLDVIPSRESNVLTISYSGTDPDFVASVANAFARAYMEVNVGLKVEPARQYASFFEEQTKAAREKLEAAQRKLSDYQQIHGITADDERLDFETAKLNETSSQLTALQALTTESQSKRQSGSIDTTSEVMLNPVITQLKTEMARVEAQLNDINTKFGSAHPDTLRAQAQLNTLRARLDAETRKVGNSFNTSYQVGKQREAQLQAALAAQKTRVLALKKQRDEFDVLKRDVESAQRAYDLVSQRASQTNIEGQVNQANIAVLTPATAPPSPAKPRVIFNLLVSVFLGTLLGVGGALILELTNRRVRSTEDLVEVLDMPVLGAVSSAAGMLPYTPTGGRA